MTKANDNSKIMTGDTVQFYVADLTRWNRFISWLTGKPIPSKLQVFTVVYTYGEEAVAIKPIASE